MDRDQNQTADGKGDRLWTSVVKNLRGQWRSFWRGTHAEYTKSTELADLPSTSDHESCAPTQAANHEVVFWWPAATNSAESAPLLSNDATGTSAFQDSITYCDASTGACPSSRAQMPADQQALIPNASHAGGQTRGPAGPYLPELRSNAADKVVDARRLTLFQRARQALGQTWDWVWILVAVVAVAVDPFPLIAGFTQHTFWHNVAIVAVGTTVGLAMAAITNIVHAALIPALQEARWFARTHSAQLAVQDRQASWHIIWALLALVGECSLLLTVHKASRCLLNQERDADGPAGEAPPPTPTPDDADGDLSSDLLTFSTIEVTMLVWLVVCCACAVMRWRLMSAISQEEYAQNEEARLYTVETVARASQLDPEDRSKALTALAAVVTDGSATLFCSTAVLHVGCLYAPEFAVNYDCVKPFKLTTRNGQGEDVPRSETQVLEGVPEERRAQHERRTDRADDVLTDANVAMAVEKCVRLVQNCAHNYVARRNAAASRFMVLDIGLGIVMLVVVATYAAKIPLSVAVGLGALCKVMHLNPESTFSDQEYAFLLSMKVKVGSLVVFRGRLAWVNWASVTELVFEPIDSAPCQTIPTSQMRPNDIKDCSAAGFVRLAMSFWLSANNESTLQGAETALRAHCTSCISRHSQEEWSCTEESCYVSCSYFVRQPCPAKDCHLEFCLSTAGVLSTAAFNVRRFWAVAILKESITQWSNRQNIQVCFRECQLASIP